MIALSQIRYWLRESRSRRVVSWLAGFGTNKPISRIWRRTRLRDGRTQFDSVWRGAAIGPRVSREPTDVQNNLSALRICERRGQPARAAAKQRNWSLCHV
jgi:hypothetical protein